MKLVQVFLRVVVMVAGLSVLASACGENEPSRFELLQANPMANPVLSFSEVEGQTSKEGTAGGLVGLDTETVHTTRFVFDTEMDSLAFEELSAQAIAAGFDLELITHEGGLPYGSWQGRNPEGFLLSILLSPGRSQVELR